MKPLHECQLYTFVDVAYLHGRSPEDIAQQLCEGGSDLIQLRAKTASTDEVQRLAERLLPRIEAAGVGLVINDYPSIAARIGAPVCHLGQEDFFDRGYSHVRQVTATTAGPGRTELPLQFGLSSHAPAQAERALAAGADYIAIGPVFPTSTKPTAKPVTLDYVRWAASHVQHPWFAIGGITLENLDAVLAAGARRICVVSAVLTSLDLVRTCQIFKQRLVSAGLAKPKTHHSSTDHCS